MYSSTNGINSAYYQYWSSAITRRRREHVYGVLYYIMYIEDKEMTRKAHGRSAWENCTSFGKF